MQDPNFTSMLVLNTFTNATKKITAIRSTLKNNDLLRQMYPDRMLDSSCQDSAEAVTLPRKVAFADATFSACGMGTQATSRHVECIIEDDTIAPEKDHMTSVLMLPSKEQIEKAIGYHKILEFILQDHKISQRIVVGTRWCERDMFSHIKENEPQYRFIERAARENADGKADDRGEFTYPTRFDEQVLRDLENTVGGFMFQALMMNNPLNPSTMLFHRDDIKLFDSPPAHLMVFTSVDLAPSEEDASGDPDYNVVMSCGLDLTTGNIYVLDYFRARTNPGRVVDEIINHIQLYAPVKIIVESINYQATLKYWLEERMVNSGIFCVIEKAPFPQTQKGARIRGLQPVVSRNRLHVREWMTDLIGELENFGRGAAHDDIADALSMQQLAWRASQKVTDVYDSPGSCILSGEALLEELYGRSKSIKGFPYDCLPSGLVENPYRDDYIYNN